MPRYLLIPTLAMAFSVSFAQTEPTPKAFLDLVASKTDLAPGECAIVKLSFVVYDDNKAPLHFYELQQQLNDNIVQSLMPKNSYVVPSKIENIEAKRELIGNENASRYDIYEGGICPIAAGTITIPPVKLDIRQRLVLKPDTILVPFKATGFTLKTTSDPEYENARKNGPIATGTFTLIELLRKEEVNVGEPFVYQMLIDGMGQSLLLFPSTVNTEKFDVNLQSTELRDYIDHDMLSAYKVLKFEITPKEGTEGTFSMASIFEQLSFFDPVSKSIRSLDPKKTIKVINKPASESAARKLLPSDNKKTFVFLLDISQSMAIADYKPTRMEFMKKQLSALTAKGYSIEPIVFAGFAKPVSSRTELHNIDEISHTMIKERGTAIGDALMFAIQYIKTSGRDYSKNVFIAGDGDDTGSVVPSEIATEYAKANGFTINAIGIGSPGLVPYGADENGKPYMIDNTFSDKDFKMMTTMTGGRYVPVKTNSNLAELLKDVLLKP